MGVIDYTTPDAPTFYAADSTDNGESAEQDEGLFGTDVTEQPETETPPANSVPVATDDNNIYTNQNTIVSIDVLSNDMDSDGDSLTIASVTQGTNGRVEINGNNVIYTPDSEFHGTDSFTYTVSDGKGGTDTATINVIVNDAPEGVDDPDISTDEDTAVIIDVLANDIDAEDDLSIESVTQGTNGVVVNNGNDVTYTPGQDFNGTDSFTYTISDGYRTDTATVTVDVTSVNDAAVVTGDTTGAVNEGNIGDPATTASGDLVITDVDADDTPFFANQESTIGDSGYGSFDLIDGTWTYTLDQDIVQDLDAGDQVTDTITFTASDNTTQEVTVTITGTNDAPTVVNNIPDQSTTQYEAFNFTFAEDSFSDVDTSDILTYTATLLDGSALPGWLDFNEATRTFSGTPDDGDVDTIDVKVIADDGGGSGTAVDVFVLTVQGAGTTGDDIITGTGNANFIHGFEGNDEIYGEGGDDELYGDEGNDTLKGGAGNDILKGVEGNDTLNGGSGDDLLDGGTIIDNNPRDMADYQNDPGGITATINYDPASGTPFDGSTINDGWGDTDTIDNITRFKGSAFDDSITINMTENDDSFDLRWYLWGMAGNDTLTGTAGERVGAMYLEDPSGVNIDLSLASGQVIDGWENTDTLKDIQAVSGSNYADLILGSASDEGFFGTLGNDSIDGQGGWNWIAYGWLNGEDNFGGVDIDLASGSAQGRDSAGAILFTDSLANIEGAYGTKFNDTIIGNDLDNDFGGEGGDDIMQGGAGNDYFEGDLGNDTIDGQGDWDHVSYRGIDSSYFTGIIADLGLTSGSVQGKHTDGSTLFTDTLINIEGIGSTVYDDILTGNEQNNDFEMYEGDDYVDGMGGWDHVSYRWNENPVFNGIIANLNSGSVQGKHIDGSILFTDTLINIEGIGSTVYDDILTGNDQDNYFQMYEGNDTIDGGQGFDSIDYTWLNNNENSDYIKLEFDPTESFMTVTGYGSDSSQIFSDTLYNIESFQGTSGEDTLEGNNEDNWFAGEAGADLLKGNFGNDVFSFTDSNSIDSVLDFTTGEENDVLRFDEFMGLGFNAQGGEYDIYTSANNYSPVDPTVYKIVGVTDSVFDWLYVASILNGAVSAGSGDGTNDGTYFVVSNESEGRVYYWEGDTNPDLDSIDNMVDEYELTHFVTLDQFDNNDVLSLSDVNFQIDFDSADY